MLAQLSDPHVLDGDDASALALEAGVRGALALNPLPDAVLVSGDLAATPTVSEYELVGELLEPLPMPVHVLLGNHDDPDLLRDRFGSPPSYSVAIGDELRLVVCDTRRAGSDAGVLGADRLAWLEAELQTDTERPTIVAMHHPPVSIGLTAIDGIGLPREDRLALGELLPSFPQVRRVVAGHVHRASFSMLGRCPVVTVPSTYIQARLEFGVDAFNMAPEPPAFGVHALVEGEIVSHIQPIFG